MPNEPVIVFRVTRGDAIVGWGMKYATGRVAVEWLPDSDFAPHSNELDEFEEIRQVGELFDVNVEIVVAFDCRAELPPSEEDITDVVG